MKDERADGSSQARTVISTKNMELDSKMGGGLPVGCLTLIEGASGAGKSVLTQQILWGALQDGFRATIFTSENTVKSLVKQMQSIDLDIIDHLLLRRMRIFPLETSGRGEDAPHALLEAIKDQQDQNVIAVDSFTSIISQTQDRATIINFLEECKRVCARDVTMLLSLHSQVIQDDLIGTIRSMCDAHVRLRAEQDGQRIVKTLEVLKIQGAASVTGAVVGFDVEPGWGMRVIPISKARG
jgi:flagellar protein FlaH